MKVIALPIQKDQSLTFSGFSQPSDLVGIPFSKTMCFIHSNINCRDWLFCESYFQFVREDLLSHSNSV